MTPTVKPNPEHVELFPNGYTLGLDIGSNSLGWALVGNAPGQIVCGVRIFQEGTERKSTGQEESRAAHRRGKRQSRRQLERRKRRWKKTARVLVEAGLLPAKKKDLGSLAQVDPYQLRARGLREKLDPYELGRAIYHLGKRRGFRSSAKAKAQEDAKEVKAVAEGISALENQIKQAHTTTVGEYLAKVNPHEERRRKRYLGRNQIQEEFEALWEAQLPYYPDILNPELRERLENAIFFQRPLKSQKERIGKCRLEPEEQRAHQGLWISHQTRVLQELNNLRVIFADGSERPLESEERRKALESLMSNKSAVKFKKLRKDMKLPEDATLNLEEGGRKSMKPQVVEAALKKIFKKRWKQDADLLRFEVWSAFLDQEEQEFDGSCEAKGWNVTPEEKAELGKLLREAGDSHGKLSAKALKRLLPHLEAGLEMYAAIEKEYPRQEATAVDIIDPINPEDIINPVVRRALSEMRKVVNTIIREYGKPKDIKVEMARETKATIPERNRLLSENRKQEKERQEARKALEDANIHPTGGAIKKYRLWKECKRECPYTGKPISFEALFGDNPEFDIEHILPYSRTFDNSWMNLTLCENRFNREVKRNRTPYEALGDLDPRFQQIVARVKNNLLMPWPKRRRFWQKEIPDEFVNRQLTDTSYAARQTLEILRSLGVPTKTTKGPITAAVRQFLGLNNVLPKPGEEKAFERKDRGDHRHHAVDAIAVTQTSQKTDWILGKRFEWDESHDSMAGAEKLARFHLSPPWPEFFEDAHRAVQGIIVSFRPDRRLAGGFTKETNYGKIAIRDANGTSEEVFVRRVRLEDLKPPMISRIVDQGVRAIIEERLGSLGIDHKAKGVQLNKGWSEDLRMARRDGSLGPPVHKVRVWESASSMIPIFDGPDGQPSRYLAAGENHHIAFYREEMPDGSIEWYPLVRSRYDVSQIHEANKKRKKRGETPDFLVHPRHPDHPNARCAIWLMKGDTVLWRDNNGIETPFTVEGISGPPTTRLDMLLRHHCDALGESRKEPHAHRVTFLGTIKTDGNLRIRKVQVDPIGRIEALNDAPDD